MTSSEAIETNPKNNVVGKKEKLKEETVSKKRERDDSACAANEDSNDLQPNVYIKSERVTEKEPESLKMEVDDKKEKGEDEYVFSPELLGMYYSRLFPFDLLYSWLSYDTSLAKPSIKQEKQGSNNDTEQGAPSIFSNREFSFTIEKTPGDEIYIRFKSFPTKKDMQSTICKMRPNKIDLGAVYSHPPKDKDAFQAFKPTQRELVFDIDLTDYDDVRHCGCQGAKICPKCWKFMGMAIKVMNRGLKEDFGFRHIVWFYSGRRGVHAWVCDPSARHLTNDARTAIASYFEIMTSTDKNKNLSHLTSPLHPLLARSFDVLEPLFIKDVLPKTGHGLLATPSACEELLSSLPEFAKKIQDKLIVKWESSHFSPKEKWNHIKNFIDIFLKANKKTSSSKQAKTLSYADSLKLETWKYMIVFQYAYPRLDINVSKAQNHLLKSPFCIHPKTGRVCVPIDSERVDEFDPFDVPTLPQLMRELDAFARESAKQSEGNESKETTGNVSRKKIQYDWQKTSLNDSFDYFRRRFLIPMQKDLLKEERKIKEEKAAYIGDF